MPEGVTVLSHELFHLHDSVKRKPIRFLGPPLREGDKIPETVLEDLFARSLWHRRPRRRGNFYADSLLLNFMAPGCSACGRHHDEIARALRSVGSRAPRLLTLTPSHMSAADRGAAPDRVLETFMIRVLPTHILIGRDGRLIRRTECSPNCSPDVFMNMPAGGGETRASL